MAPRYGRGPRGQCFLAWVEQALAPTLKPDDIMVMDNLSAHKVAGVRQAIKIKGAKIAHLPPYSPDFNPIDQLFAKLKHLLRKQKHEPSTTSGQPSVSCSTTSSPTNAATTS